jgi:multiple sugar transport system permease protein
VANYRALWHDPLFWVSAKNTLAFTAMAGPTLVVGGLALAMLLDQPFHGRNLARVLVFAPYAVMSAVVGVLWNWLYDTNFGIINYYLRLLGLPAVAWLTNERVALAAIALTTVWWTVGYNVVIYLAGLQDIPTELQEAAIVDGATSWQRFWSITLPLLTPTTYAVVILTLINTGQVFDQIYVMTAGGPGTATLTLVQYMYYQAFQTYNLGYGAGVAYATFVGLLLLTLMVQRFFRREVA